MNWIFILAGLNILISINHSHDESQTFAPSDKVKRFEIAYGDTLQYDLGYFGDEESAHIAKEPRYNAFRGFCSKDREPLIYCYTAATKFEGKDTVQLTMERGSGGSGPNPDHVTIELIIELQYD